jgi:flagellar motor switch protein FliN
MSSNVVTRVELPILNNASNEKGRALGERMELVEQVQVKLTVTLGEAELSIAKLFALTPNEVISLDRDVDAPVDIRLNGRIVARGTLVAAGDKFGVRITEIQSESR